MEEIGRRLVGRGHEVVVYCRGAEHPRPDRYLGMELYLSGRPEAVAGDPEPHRPVDVHLSLSRRRVDSAIVFNAANAPFVPFLRGNRVPLAVHVDGLEWRRAKWSGAGQRYYRAVESLSVRWADALIADAQGIADYYQEEFGARTELLTYGAPILEDPESERIAELGLLPKKYHLVVARLEPENHVAEIVAGYRESGATLPLVVVGSAPYAHEYTARTRALAEGDSRIQMVGGIWDQDQLDQLYAHSLTYLHGHSVGGTNPSLLRAMGAAAGVIAYDVGFNREVLGPDGRYFSTPAGLAVLLRQAETEPTAFVDQGVRLQARAAATYSWDEVAVGYETLLKRLADRDPSLSGNKGLGRRHPRG